MSDEKKLARILAVASHMPDADKLAVGDALKRMGILVHRTVAGVGVLPPANDAHFKEWDLTVANTLDDLYNAVMGRAEELGGKAWEVAKKGLSASILPLLLVVAAVLLLSRR
jgi:hypothetical protein